MSEPQPEKDTKTDWQQIKRRLAAVQDAIDQSWQPSQEEIQCLLKERARLLAEPPPATEKADEYLEIVEFDLAYERYAFALSHVREVSPLKNLTPLPCTPAFVLGIINLRGEIVSIIDLKNFFDLPEKGLTDLNKVIVLHDKDMTFGILADKILGTRPIKLSTLQSSLPTLTGIRATYLQGVTSERTVVLNAAKLLASKNLIVHEQVTG